MTTSDEPAYEPYVAPAEAPERLPDADLVGRLAPAPRPVSPALRLATTTLGPVETFLVLVLMVSPMALWILVDGALLVGAVVALAIVGARCARRYHRRVPLLRDGEVATVTSVQQAPTATSYSSVPMRRARGWRTRWTSYTGQGVRTDLAFTVAGRPGSLRLSGPPYDGGVVLADPSHPERALCVSELSCDVEPGPDGQLPRGLSPSAWLVVGLTIGVLLALVGVAGLGVVLLLG